jgi:aspartyl-tRNA(Asn)/glutamyl-tRNA(Gln) amidotransferase subunit A
MSDTPTIEQARPAGHTQMISAAEQIARLRSDKSGAFVCLAAEDATPAAESAETPLAEITVAVKDNIDVEGLPTRIGRAGYEPTPARRDAKVVSRLRALGAPIVAKTAMHELALGITGENRRVGTPQNPWGTDRLPGGSSSGSAVAVARGLVRVAVGTDTGGSCRVPAALCGTVGFKPTFDLLERDGVFPLSERMDHVGLLARQVADVELVFGALSDQPPARAEDRPLAVAGSLFDAAHPAVAEALRDVVEQIVANVSDIEEQALPELLHAPDTYRPLLLHDALSVHEQRLARAPESFGDDTRALLQQAQTLSPTLAHQAWQQRQALREQLAQLLSRYQALITPAALVVAPFVGQNTVDTGIGALDTRRALLLPTCAFSMVGFPACVLPAGRVDGLPVALQVVAAPGQDSALLSLCARIERVAQARKDPRL